MKMRYITTNTSLMMEIPSDYVLRFGRHKGKRLSQVPMKYLNWMLRECTGDGHAYMVSQIREYKKSLKKKISCK